MDENSDTLPSRTVVFCVVLWLCSLNKDLTNGDEITLTVPFVLRFWTCWSCAYVY